MSNIVNLIRENIDDSIKKLGYEIYHIEYVKELGHNFLRIMIENQDSEMKVSVKDCEIVSKTINELIDNLNIDDKFFLEVSSPGINRKLYTVEHMRGVVNCNVSIKLNKSVDGNKKYKGLLKNVNEDEIILSVEERDLKISIDNIKSINLEEIS